jgi:hypothetical protein
LKSVEVAVTANRMIAPAAKTMMPVAVPMSLPPADQSALKRSIPPCRSAETLNIGTVCKIPNV